MINLTAMGQLRNANEILKMRVYMSVGVTWTLME
jgi:hypothetical protein